MSQNKIKPRIGVTGASGFVGQGIKTSLQKSGYDLIELGRRASSSTSTYRRFLLGEDLSPGLLDGIDVLIHAAFDLKEKEEAKNFTTNVLGSKKLLEEAKRRGIKVIFISSISAFEGCTSVLGQNKLACEEATLSMHGIVVRPGLVFDPHAETGGMLGKLEKMVRLLPILPLAGGGKQAQFMCNIHDLGRLIETLVSNFEPHQGQVVTAAASQAYSFREIIQNLSRKLERRNLLISIPADLALLGIAVLEKCRFPVPFRRDNLVSLLNQNPAPNFETLRKVCSFQFSTPDWR